MKPSKMTDLSENFVGEYLDYVDGDANSNDGDDKKSLKPHAQVHLLSATENCKVTNFAEFLLNHYQPMREEFTAESTY